MKIKSILIGILCIFVLVETKADACTSAIFTARASGIGRPVMLKHRDTGHLDNRIERFQGPKYSFIGLTNSDRDQGKSEAHTSFEGVEVWSGVNDAGFCIMNTAAYNFNEGDYPDEIMDREGIVMYGALGICATVDEFEAYLNSLPKPWGVETNFGVIDAFGGAAYFEVNNQLYVRHNVEDTPNGYMVVTNWCESGRPKDRKGVDRREKTDKIILSKRGCCFNAESLINDISRSGKPILRNITSASIVFEGVAPEMDAKHTVMWTVLGYPVSAVVVPLRVDCTVPEALQGKADGHAPLCDLAMKLKKEKVDVLDLVRAEEANFIPEYRALQSRYEAGKVSERYFSKKSKKLINKYLEQYMRISVPARVAELPEND